MADHPLHGTGTPGKSIVVCSDGTGNMDIVGRGTNVFKLFEAVDLTGHRVDPAVTPQVALYDDGVGTENFKPLKLFSGATGWGLSRNVKSLYKELVRVHDPGDRIFLFGFSRGAFTVRTLAGLIGAVGLLDTSRYPSADALDDGVNAAYKVYRRRYRTDLMQLVAGPPDTSEIARFRERCCRPGTVPIAFVGVWDTVDAVGVPFHLGDVINVAIYRFKFPDHHLGGAVERACHALSVDDQRATFHPLLWQSRGADDDRRIDQVWFSGVHSNVGGGYPKQGMSLVTLDWMLTKAEDAGLRLLDTDRAAYRRHANVDDKLYDSRAGLGSFYRWKPRDIAATCRDANVIPALHLSVLERVAHGTGDYAPGNLAPDARVVITPTGDYAKDDAMSARAAGVQEALRAAHAADGAPLLARVGGAVVMGRASYYAYVLSCLLVVMAAATLGAGSGKNPWEYVKNGARFVAAVATLDWGVLLETGKRLVASPWIVLVVGFLLSSLLERVSRRRTRGVFSSFWHEQQQVLRAVLKAARVSAARRAAP